MKTILAIETSCDETAVSILECTGDFNSASFRVAGNALLSQIDLHREYGGVYPAIAKREHAKNLVPLLASALEEAELLHEDIQPVSSELDERLVVLLEREPELWSALSAFLHESERPQIDAIAVTAGPGLEPALWVGVNFARALAIAWDLPLVSVNHMEGHIISALVKEDGDGYRVEDTALPLLALLISGGHTELVVMRDWLSYERIGETRDDAVGEAFDKVARMLDLPYPGGPEVSKLAEEDREDSSTNPFSLPRPMIDSPDLDFSFSGLKTAVLYTVKEQGALSPLQKRQLARAFEDAAADVLVAKSLKAIQQTGARTLAIGGGVSANIHIRRALAEALAESEPEVTLCIPGIELTGDNAVMIGMAGYFRLLKQDVADPETLAADGNRCLS